jgi:hypothetical protein
MIAVSLYFFGMIPFHVFRSIHAGAQKTIDYRYFKQNPDKYCLYFIPNYKKMNAIQDETEAFIEGCKDVDFFDIITISYPVLIPFYSYKLLTLKKEDVSDFLKLFLNKI